MAAFVLGNGVSRNSVDFDVLIKLGPVYGCNALYRTHTPTVLVATDRPISEMIQESGYSKKNKFYTRRPLKNLGGMSIPQPYFGFSSGPIAAALAAEDRHTPIYLVGFDMGPGKHGRFNNIYADTEFYKKTEDHPTYTGNWIQQLCTVAKKFKDQTFIRVHGSTTANVPEFDAVPNFQKLDIEEFLARINKAKGL